MYHMTLFSVYLVYLQDGWVELSVSSVRLLLLSFTSHCCCGDLYSVLMNFTPVISFHPVVFEVFGPFFL